MATCGRCGAENTPEARFCNRCGTALPGATERDGRETRRVVTILFADLVGSTALSERLDPERWRAVQGRYFTALRDTIERHGGLVEKFIGDAVMAVFGLPAAHEDDALRAVRAAAELTPALSDLNNELRRSNGLGLRLRVGVNTGEVVAAEGGSGDAIASGDTVSTAARLEQSAEPGEVILGLGTYSLVRDAVQAEALNPLDLRGKAGPTAAYRLIRVVGGEAHARRLDAPMVGRGSELDVLERSLERAIAGPSAELVTIVGTAGVGKSRLVRAFLNSAAGRAPWPGADACRMATASRIGRSPRSSGTSPGWIRLPAGRTPWRSWPRWSHRGSSSASRASALFIWDLEPENHRDPDSLLLGRRRVIYGLAKIPVPFLAARSYVTPLTRYTHSFLSFCGGNNWACT